MGKLCAVLITFSPSSGPSISIPQVRWVKLSLISFLSRCVLKALFSSSVSNENDANERNTKLNLIVYSRISTSLDRRGLKLFKNFVRRAEANVKIIYFA